MDSRVKIDIDMFICLLPSNIHNGLIINIAFIIYQVSIPNLDGKQGWKYAIASRNLYDELMHRRGRPGCGELA